MSIKSTAKGLMVSPLLGAVLLAGGAFMALQGQKGTRRGVGGGFGGGAGYAGYGAPFDLQAFLDAFSQIVPTPPISATTTNPFQQTIDAMKEGPIKTIYAPQDNPFQQAIDAIKGVGPEITIWQEEPGGIIQSVVGGTTKGAGTLMRETAEKYNRYLPSTPVSEVAAPSAPAPTGLGGQAVTSAYASWVSQYR